MTVCSLYTGNVYDAIYDVAAFARAGGRIDSSPAEEVLTDFASLGFSCDDLYTTLARMDARQAMETLEEHGKATFNETNQFMGQMSHI